MEEIICECSLEEGHPQCSNISEHTQRQILDYIQDAASTVKTTPPAPLAGSVAYEVTKRTGEERDKLSEKAFKKPIEIITAESESSTGEPVYLCKCLRSSDSEQSEKVVIPPRKQKILTTVSRTEQYLLERRIPELIRFLLAKVISDAPEKPMCYLEQLLDDCMMYRSGLGSSPALFETGHLEAIVKSFDPGQSGWLSEAQVRRAFMTIGVPPPVGALDGRVNTEDVLKMLTDAQEKGLKSLLTAGTQDKGDEASKTVSSSSGCKCSDLNLNSV